MKKKYSHRDRIAILQQVIPRYRDNFFKELSLKSDIELYAGKKSLLKPGSIVTKNKSYKINIVKNSNFYGKILFQILPFKELYYKKIVIFEFNIRLISSVLLLLFRIISNKKNILWTHGLTDRMSTLSKIIRIYFMKRANSIIVYEDTAKKDLIKLGVLKQKIFVAKNSIDIRKNIRLLDKKKKKFRITFIGRIIPEKNVQLLSRAFLDIINKIEKSIILTIIGGGEDLKKLKKKYNHKRIEFIGHLDDEKKISYYLNQTLFTVSPDYLGLAIVHSFSYSVPILVNKNPKQQHSPEIELMQNNKNGWYFNGSQKDLGNQIIKFLNKKKS